MPKPMLRPPRKVANDSRPKVRPGARPDPTGNSGRSPAINPDEWLNNLWLDVQTAGHLRRVVHHCLGNQSLSEPYRQACIEGMEMVERLAPMGVDRHCLMAGFLYRLHEQGLLPTEQVGPIASAETASLLTSVGDLGDLGDIRERGSGKRLQGQKQSQIENIRNMVLAMSDDLRVTLLRLAERATCLSRAHRTQAPHLHATARQVLRIYAPIAARLGVHRLKGEMEDLCLQALSPRQAARIAATVRELEEQWESVADGVIQTLAAALREAGIASGVDSRIKNLYGIWRKMRRKGVGLNRLHDVLGLRVIVNSVPDCYLALSHVHGLWAHLSDEFDDYIGNSKTNGYRSIHTAVVIPRIGTLEVQIRTEEMDREAEYGACAHWRYKGEDVSNPWFQTRVRKLRQLAGGQPEEGEEPDSSALAEILLEDSLSRHIYVFTPDGDALELPHGATVLDFAYHVHADIGHRCIGGLVNSRPVGIDQVLRNGQSVEVTTGAQRNPRRHWLDADAGFLHTMRARHSVQYWFRRLDATRIRQNGERILLAELKKFDLSATALRELAKALKQPTVDDMLFHTGSKRLSLEAVREKVRVLARSGRSS